MLAMIMAAAPARVGFGMAASAAWVGVGMAASAWMNIGMVVVARIRSAASPVDPRAVPKPRAPAVNDATSAADLAHAARPGERDERQYEEAKGAPARAFRGPRARGWEAIAEAGLDGRRRIEFDVHGIDEGTGE
jgi:hypothetical protein